MLKGPRSVDRSLCPLQKKRIKRSEATGSAWDTKDGISRAGRMNVTQRGS